MLIGILSDTHDRVDAAAAAMKLLRGQNCEFFIHCGDVGNEGVLDCLAGERAAFVWGNNDFGEPDLVRYAERLGIQCLGRFGDMTLDGKRFAITHGDDVRLIKRLLASQDYDYLLQGHTHMKTDRREGRTRLINPGALYRAAVKTVATLDTNRDELRFLTVNVQG
jgi:putative phosphoesterase